MPTLIDLVPEARSAFDLMNCPYTPSCADWFTGVSDESPDHMCWYIAEKSVRLFLAYWGLTDGTSPAHLTAWPLPIGARALDMWTACRAPLELGSGNFIERLFDWIQVDAATAEQLSGQTHFASISGIGPNPHPVLASIASDPNAWLFAAVHRRTEAGKLWLLGTCTLDSANVTLPNAWPRQPMWVKYAWDGPIETIRAQGDNNQSATVSYKWYAGFPYIVTISEGGGGGARVFAGKGRQVKLFPLDDLHRESRNLATWWYTMLRRTFAGRPSGSTETFRDREDFCAAVKTAIAALRARNQHVTQERVAEELHAQGRLFKRLHAQGSDPLSELKRQRKKWGYGSWDDLKNNCGM